MFEWLKLFDLPKLFEPLKLSEVLKSFELVKLFEMLKSVLELFWMFEPYPQFYFKWSVENDTKNQFD